MHRDREQIGARERGEWRVTNSGHGVSLWNDEMFSNQIVVRLHKSVNIFKTTKLYNLKQWVL